MVNYSIELNDTRSIIRMDSFDSFFDEKSVLRLSFVNGHDFLIFFYFTFPYISIIDRKWIYWGNEFLTKKVIINLVGIVLIAMSNIDKYNIHSCVYMVSKNDNYCKYSIMTSLLRKRGIFFYLFYVLFWFNRYMIFMKLLVYILILLGHE